MSNLIPPECLIRSYQIRELPKGAVVYISPNDVKVNNNLRVFVQKLAIGYDAHHARGLTIRVFRNDAGEYTLLVPQGQTFIGTEWATGIPMNRVLVVTDEN